MSNENAPKFTPGELDEIDEALRRSWNHQAKRKTCRERRMRMAIIDTIRTNRLGLASLEKETGGKMTAVEADPEKVGD